jgi:alpha-L-rhamnosidase
LYYGDKKILEENFYSMKKYVDYLSSLAVDFILPTDKYGDWASPLLGWKGGMPVSTSTGYYYYITGILAGSSLILGYSDDAEKYSSLAGKIKNAFHRHFFNEEKKTYDDGSQFANSFALFLGIVPEKDKEAVLNNLIDDIQNTHEGHLTTGILGTKYLMELLSREGRSDIAWRLATQTTSPGWISMLGNRTTLSEHWIEKGMNSHNHVMFGSIDSWFYKELGGIQADENAPGFRNIIIKPYMPDDLTWVKASVKTVNGIVSSSWAKSKKECSLNILIPFGSEALVYIPAEKGELVKEGNSLAKESDNVSFLRMENNCAVFRVGSGEYSFISHLSE